jgi:stage 0 sporulation protein J
MDFKKIPLDLVKPSPMNPRKTFDEEAINELADNIDKQGLIQPITIRPTAYEDQIDEASGEIFSVPTDYEIVCGGRRYRAFRLLKAREDKLNIERVAAHRKKYDRFQSIPAMVREMTDEEAFEAMITENLQRQDVDPMEEAFAFSQLIQKGKTAEEVAVRFGKSIRFVQDRVKLNNLIPELMMAIKDDKMSIAAAMIIAKLDEEHQRRYFSSYSNNYKGFSKQTAESFTRSLFMSIDGAPWYQTDNQEDEDYTGGCGVTCSECQFNTANHGCLFWEMKTEDAGKCTDRAKFYAKHSAYILDILSNYDIPIIKHGAPLEAGNVVIIDEEDYCTPSTKALKASVYESIKAAGFEVIKANEIFDGKCSYTDKRLDRNIEMGNVYQCLKIFTYDNVKFETQWRYLKGKRDMIEESAGKEKTPATSVQSADAMKLIQKRNRMKEIAMENIAAESRTMANNLGEAKRKGELSDAEMFAFQCIIFSLCGSEMLKRYGHKGFGKVTDRSFISVIKQNRADWPKWIREFMRTIFGSADMNYNGLYQFCAGEVLEEWMPKEWREMVHKFRMKLDKDLAKNAEKLKELGYGTDGKLLPQSKESVVKSVVESTTTEKISAPKENDIQKLFKEMKVKHPDSILLFRINDFYECIAEDAEKAAKTLKLTLTTTRGYKLVGFPHHALDMYLPRLIKAGHRVAICE